ncbi:MAG: NAD(P)-dependent oxidoreductase [Oscillospiraceae bacterium]|nr:NAD(P)-dependent oxidoreductase [Oscillospiraceae bacterium]
MKIFITGGTGNIGQYVVLDAIAKGHQAVVLSRTPEKHSALSEMKGVSLVKGTITDYDILRDCVKSCDAVIHIALGWGDEPVTMLQADTTATVHLLEMSERAGIKKFIYTSSTAAMGRMRDNMDETVMNLPLDLYGSTKSASEAYVLGFSNYYGETLVSGNAVGMKRNIIRPGYTFSNPPYPGGSSQSDRRFRDITNAVVTNQPIQVIARDGTQFLSAEQIAKLYTALLESDLNEEIFLVLGKEYTTWERVAQIALEEYPSSKSIIDLYDAGWGEPMLYNIEKMNRIFGLEFSGEDEIRKHVKWNLEMSLSGK